MQRVAKKRHSESGVSSVVMAVLLFFFVGFVGLTIDLGNIFLMKIRLQNAADTAALSAIGDIVNSEKIACAVAEKYRCLHDHPEALNVMRGSWDAEGKNFIPAVDGNALRVTLEQQVPVYFLKLLGAAETQKVRAVATADLKKAGAVVKLGATAIDINTDEGTLLKGLLGSMLGTSLQLSAVGWQGILDARVDLVRFINLAKLHLNVGSIDGLLEAELTVGEILDLMAEALQADEHTAAVELKVLNQHILATSIAPLQTKLKLGELLQVDTNRGALTKAEINALSMVTAVAELFNHKSAVSAETSITLKGLMDVDLKVNIVEPPVIKIMQEGSTIHSAGARVYLNAEVLSLLGGLLKVPLYLELGSGDAQLTGISEDGVELQTGSSLAKLYLGEIGEESFFSDTTLGANDLEKATVLNLLELVKADARAYTDAAGSSGTMTVPPESFGETFNEHNELGGAVGGLVGSLLGQGNLELDVKLLGLNLGLGDITNDLLGQLSSSVLSPLLGALLDPVSMLTGVFPGRTDVTVYDYAYEAVLVN